MENFENRNCNRLTENFLEIPSAPAYSIKYQHNHNENIRTSDEVVSVEVAEANASSRADSHDCLKGRGTHQIVMQLVLVLGT